ncbi:MAG TPA: MltA-interacting protein MipA [Proteus sp.]|nr:MipA/OmpV family protein [Proteus hauseri]QAV25259.1 MltA-interacting protein MipA [Proteus hauseri]HCH50718.1 MltA-interacting protein MipA [Proteus sp. (in: enterobacteria)]
MVSKKTIISLAIIAGLSAPTAFAGEWSIGGSVLAQVTPYKGVKSKDYLLPVPMVNYESENFYFATLAAGYYLWNAPKDKLSVDLHYYPQAFKPGDSDDAQMKKLDRRRDTLMGGFTYKHQEDWGSLRAIISADLLGKSDGVIADAAYLYPFKAGNWSLQPGLGVVWDSKKQNQYAYGVKHSESQRSGLAEYNPSDSWRPYVELSANYKMTDSWNFFAMGRVDHLSSEVKDSPMVNKSVTAIVWTGVTYKF